MVRAIVWKEFREQGLIGLSLVVLGGGVLVAVYYLADPPQGNVPPGDVLRALGPGPLATLLLAVTAGTVCGGALFAAEREAGTHGFLDALPVPRARLWVGKLVAGGLLAGLQAGAVIAAGLALGLLATAGWAVAVAVYALLAFCWGVLGSTLARTTLGSVGVAVPAATLFAFVYLFPILLVFQSGGSPLPRPAGAFLFLGLMFVTPLAWSAVAYTRPDREREEDERVAPPPAVYRAEPEAPAPRPAAAAVYPRKSRVGFKALVWLSLRQLTGPGPALAAFALAAGLALLLPTIDPFVTWPALAVTAGVLAGVTAFADEQVRGSARFWGEQRLPAGRMWLVRVGMHLALAVVLAALVVLPWAVRAVLPGGTGVRGDAALSAVFRSLMFEPRNLGPEGWKYLLAPLGYGFAAGVVCGMLFKKPVVGAGVAGVVGGTGFAAALPGLLAGGVWHLWLWLPPALALAAGRAVLRAWAADRVATRRGLAPLAGGLLAAAAVAAAAVGFRAAEVPDVGRDSDDAAYVVALGEQNEAGREFRTAAEQFARTAMLPVVHRPGGRALRPAERIELLRTAGPVAEDKELGEWVVAVYELDRPPPGPPGAAVPPAGPTWYELARHAADPRLAVGLFEHPQLTPTTAGSPALENARGMGVVLLAHGMYRQAAGDPAAFPDDMGTVLALARSMRNGGVTAALHRGNDLTALALAAATRWLARAGGDRPELLRAALDEVLRDDRAVMTRFLPDGGLGRADVPPGGWGEPFDPLPHQLADRFVVREQMRAPTQWLPAQLTPPGRDKEAANPAVELVSFAWSVPWERERTRRLVAYGLEPGHGDEYRALTRGRPGAALLNVRPSAVAELTATDLFLRACRRALAVELAARLYRARHGTFPPDLAALVAGGFLPAPPPDPYSPTAAPLGYRVPEAEEFLPPEQPPPGSLGPQPVRVAAGQPIIWSVGPDQVDGGGRSSPVAAGVAARVGDLVFVVPLSPPPPGP